MLNLIYSDHCIAVIEKSPGMLSIPGRGKDKQDSAATRIRRLFPDSIEQPSVHRLDMDTSGLLVFALTKQAHRNLSIQFEKSLVSKKYIAVLEGLLDKRLGEHGRIELKFRLDPLNRPYQIYDAAQGKTGITKWKKLSEREHDSRTRVEFEPLTGRTHQLRLHSAQPVDFSRTEHGGMNHGRLNHGGLGCPIVGDRLYGSSSDEEHQAGTRMLLHATRIEFAHPDNGEIMTFCSNPPF